MITSLYVDFDSLLLLSLLSDVMSDHYKLTGAMYLFIDVTPAIVAHHKTISQ